MPSVRQAAQTARTPQQLQARQQDEATLSAQIKGLRIDKHVFFDTPTFVRSTSRFLTQPIARGQIVPKDIVKGFVNAHRDLFEISATELTQARMSRQIVTQHNGVTHFTFQQQIGGIDLYGCEVKANVTARGSLINISSTMLPRPVRRLETGATVGDFQPPAPIINPLDAIRAAAADIGVAITVDPSPLSAPQGVNHKQIWSRTPDFRTDIPITTQLIYFPLTRSDIRPAWSLVLPEIGIGNTYEMMVDAINGKVLRRWNQLHFASTEPVTLRVYTNDSPQPGSPGTTTPNGFQFPEVPRDLLIINPIDVTAFSPDGWINDGDTDTQGNNVDAHLDLNGDNVPDLPRPNGGAGRVFDFPIDLSMEPSTYQDAVVTQLFYLNNVYHDRLYALGFDEAAGNFQTNNFAMGGVGNDRVQADAQDNFPGSVNNANFGTSGADGSAARMQMFIFNGPTPDIDGDLDSEIVFHEHSHGLSIRLLGGAVFGAQSGGMGEGWGDYFAIALNAEPTDDPHGVYSMGAYATFQLSAQVDNYYFGIRRFPYSTDMLKNPETYADIDPGQISFPPGVPQSPIIGNIAAEVHNVGEVWCMALLECRANLWNIMGFPANDLMMQLVVDGLKLSPGGPTFLQARDAILQADLVNNGAANHNALWAGFAKRGIGFSATSPPDSTTSGIVEAFDLPIGLRVTPVTELISQGLSGGPFTPNSIIYTLDSIDDAVIGYSVTATQPWLTITNASGTVGGGITATVTVSLNATANTLLDGRFTDTVNFVNTTDGIGDTTRDVVLTIGIPVVVVDERLDVDPGWTRAGDWAYGQPTGGGSGNGDPTSGFTGNNVFGYNLNGDYPNNLPATFLTTSAFDFTGLSAVSLQFRRWLGVESNSNFDEATVEVSNNGITWTVVWQATATGADVSDASWQLQTLDIAAVADNQPTVFIRWGMGPTDPAVTFPGWNIDDIQISAIGGQLPPLFIFFPNGLPQILPPNVAATFQVEIVDGAETLVPGSPTLHYRYDGGVFLTSTLTALAGNFFDATLPPPPCSATPEFFITADGNGGSTVANPADAPTTVFTGVIGTTTTIIDDNFETDMGWTAANLGATSGDWERGVPVNDPSWAHDPISDSDGSGQAFLTQNVNGNTDVDGGAVELMSPSIDMSVGGITIRYDYYLKLTNTTGGVDLLLVEINDNDGAGAWTEIARHDTDGGLSWRSNVITQADLDAAGVTLTSTMRLRFTANDADPQSIVEAGLDAFRVESFGCTAGVTTGACCLSNGSCSVITELSCIPSGGAYQGDGTVCTPNPCPQPTGACCLSNGSCSEITELSCIPSGGAYQGDGTVCTPNPCPQPTGACCLSNGSCSEITELSCIPSGGAYQGDGTVCTPNPCPQPTGACCLSNGSCSEITELSCIPSGGAYQGDGTVCTPNPCPQPCPLPGDMNGDTFINSGDIQGFVDAMLGTFDNCADIAAPSGTLDAADTSAFITLLMSP